MRTKEDNLRSVQVLSGYGQSNPAAWGALVAVLHDLVDRLPDDEPMDVFQLKAQRARELHGPNDGDGATCGVCLAKVDTRREDVAREMAYRLRTVAAYYRLRGTHGEDPDPAFIEREIQCGTDAVLAALPAPPVVDETEIRGLILQVDEEGGWQNIFPDEAAALAAALAALLRGATHG